MTNQDKGSRLNNKKENIMSDVTRAKFSCVEISNQGDTWKVRLTPVFSGSEKNRKFFKYTPAGEIVLQVVGSDTAGQFREGHDYYVDFTPAKEPSDG